jgi:hypothetical protein
MLHNSQYSGFGKSYHIRKRAKDKDLECIEVPVYWETTKLELIN